MLTRSVCGFVIVRPVHKAVGTEPGSGPVEWSRGGESYLHGPPESRVMLPGVDMHLRSSQYPDVVADALLTLSERPCTMVPFDESRFPDLLSEFHRTDRPTVESDSAPAVNEQLLAATDTVEAFFAEALWTSVLTPDLEGLSSEIVAVPYRDTMFESAVYRDGTPGWKVEAYLFTDERVREDIERISHRKEQYLRSLRDGRVPTAASRDHKLAEIRTKSDLLGYPDCCGERFLTERRRRFDTMLSVGDDRVAELRASGDREAVLAAFEQELATHDLTLADLNPESRLVGQLENLDIGSYFEDWSYDRLRAFFERRSRDELPAFFYAFFSEEFYPHHPRCDHAEAVGRAVESTLHRTYPDQVPLYRTTVMCNLLSHLGFDDRAVRRRLLTDIGPQPE
jgi:hypothetical protein